MPPVNPNYGQRKAQQALDCIALARIILPGANDHLIESMATDLMWVPEDRLNSMIQQHSNFTATVPESDVVVFANAPVKYINVTYNVKRPEPDLTRDKLLLMRD